MFDSRERPNHVVIAAQEPQMREMYTSLPSLTGIEFTEVSDLRSLIAAVNGAPTRLLLCETAGGDHAPVLVLMKDEKLNRVPTILITEHPIAAKTLKGHPNVLATFPKPIPELGDLDNFIEQELNRR